MSYLPSNSTCEVWLSSIQTVTIKENNQICNIIAYHFKAEALKYKKNKQKERETGK